MRKILVSILLIFSSQLIFSQPDDLAKMLEEEMSSEPTTDYATASFKTTRLVNAHTN